MMVLCMRTCFGNFWQGAESDLGLWQKFEGTSYARVVPQKEREYCHQR